MDIFNEYNNINDRYTTVYNGIDYYPDFLNESEHKELINIVKYIEYYIEGNKYLRRFGIDVPHRKLTYKGKKKEIPDYLNIIKPKLDINFNQLEVEYMMGNKASYVKESKIFDTNVLIITLGSKQELDFYRNEVKLILEPKSLLVIGEPFINYRRAYLKNKFIKINNRKYKRDLGWILTYRNIL